MTTPVRIAHFTDIHITDDPRRVRLRDLLGKRVVGWANLRFRGRFAELANAPSVTEAFVADVTDIAPDHILFTGDATSLSLPSEFERAAKLLDPLRSVAPLTGIPGNHDVYTRLAEREARFDRAFERHWESGTRSTRPPILVRLVGDAAAIVALRDSRATSWYDSSGRLGSDQLSALESILSSPELVDRRRIVALHYGPFRSDGRPDTRLHGLRDGSRLLSILYRSRVDLVVHGHLHRGFDLPATPDRPVLISNPGSLTYAAYGRAYHIYTVTDRGVDISRRMYDADRGAFCAASETDPAP